MHNDALPPGRYPLGDIVASLLADPTVGDSITLYGPAEPGLRDTTYLVDLSQEEDDDGLTPAARALGWEHAISGQLLTDVLLNLWEQGAPTDPASTAAAATHYLQHDTFLSWDQPPRLRSLAEIAADAERFRPARVPTVSRVLSHRLHKELGAEAAEALLALHGRAVSEDVVVNVADWTAWNQYGFADELGADAPYRIFAMSGAGDAWAVKTDDEGLTVVFLDVSGEVTELGVDVPALLRIADVWRVLEYREDIPDEWFHAAVQPLVPGQAAEWPWPYL
ncbi:MAG: hypothetical protein Q4G35_05925 [Propionibacteriaceae bacterium]|nr:hypothetical protein [Propionibacteriaceae bacterium]